MSFENKKIEFKEEWDELCPIYLEDIGIFEQIGTGVLIDIFDNIYLLTAAHVIDELYMSKSRSLLIPTVNGFEMIAGILYHRHLQENENRDDDKIDFSFYKLSEDMVNVLHENFIPLTDDKINFSDDYTVEHTVDVNKLNKIIDIKKVPNMMKKVYEEENFIDEQNIDKFNKSICDITITFAGFPNTKSKRRDSIHFSEIVYYRGRGLSHQEYITHKYEYDINVLAEFGKFGTMNKNFISNNSPKPQGISGGGVYKIIETKKGFDRVLIGVGHTYKSKKHLFVGTNIKFCIDMIYRMLKKETNNVHK
jgi:hypothetical protein